MHDSRTYQIHLTTADAINELQPDQQRIVDELVGVSFWTEGQCDVRLSDLFGPEDAFQPCVRKKTRSRVM